MAYQIASFDLQGHATTASLLKCNFSYSCAVSWQDFDWHGALRTPSLFSYS